MNTSIEKMADSGDNNDILDGVDLSSDDFERMLNDFIATEFEENIKESEQEVAEYEEIEKEPLLNISQQQTTTEPQENSGLKLNEHEFSLFRAYKNFMYAIDMLCESHQLELIPLHMSEEKLYPHFKKKAGQAVSRDILAGWEVLMAIFPNEMHNIQPNSSDDDLLDVAEKCEDENLQLAIISYVETLIELEGCEIDYEARKIKYERKMLEKQIYEEHQQRLARTKRYIDAIKEKNFPIDAERLVNNYFRLSNKDPDGSFKALTTNPATFAPIDFSKIRDRFFGLIKVKPQDGIRINQRIGEFLKRLKV